MQRRGALSVRRAAAAALSVVVGGAIVMVARTSTSAPPPPVTTGCSFQVTGSVKSGGGCSVEYVTYPPVDGGLPVERTSVLIEGRNPAVRIYLSFIGPPEVGSQRGQREGGAPLLGFYGTANIESNGQKWEARSHVENDFDVTVTSVRSTCIDAGVKCWEVHGRLRATVPSEILGPFAAPLTLSATF